MAGNAATVVAEIAGARYMISLDKGHRLETRQVGKGPVIIENRPVTEFAAAVDTGGKLHIAAWLLSRHLMYYTSSDGEMFTHSTLFKGDGSLRLKDCLIHCGAAVSVAYVAEMDEADTLVCYRYQQGEWEGKRIVQTEHPQRLTAYQFDGPPDAPHLLYSVKDQNRIAVLSRPVSADDTTETVVSATGALTDFCALTVGGARQSCWIADGYLVINGLRQSEDPWTCTWPHLKRDDSGVVCQWIENTLLNGATLNAQRARLRPAVVQDALQCLLALPGELRRAVVDGRTLQEAKLQSEFQDRIKAASFGPVQYSEGKTEGKAELTLTDVVRNQAVYLTRMQESVGGIERNMLRLQAEVNRLSREVASLLRDRMETIKPMPAAAPPAKSENPVEVCTTTTTAETAE